MHARRIEHINDVIVSRGATDDGLESARRMRIRDDDDWYGSVTYKWFQGLNIGEALPITKRMPLAYDKKNDWVFGASDTITAGPVGHSRNRMVRMPRECATEIDGGSLGKIVEIEEFTDKTIVAMFADWHNERIYFIYHEETDFENYALATIDYDGTNFADLTTWTTDHVSGSAGDGDEAYYYDLFFTTATTKPGIFFIKHINVDVGGGGWRTESYIQFIRNDGTDEATVIGPIKYTEAGPGGVDLYGHISSVDVLLSADKIIWTEHLSNSLFSSSSGKGHRLMVADMDGSNVTKLLARGDMPDYPTINIHEYDGYPDHICISQRDDKIYWRTAGNNPNDSLMLFRCDFDGTNIENLEIHTSPSSTAWPVVGFNLELSIGYELIGPTAYPP